MLHISKDRINTISNRTIQNLTGVTIGLTTSLASFQRTGCSGNCRSCQSCTASGIILMASILLVKYGGGVQRIKKRFNKTVDEPHSVKIGK
ncbi:hypothetical protein [Desulfitobacterium sp.]|uniref:hypothetical protein n=1 Tax=Desulfitobacterium sp. TaxID=49981 RepID=UPI002B1F9CE3|nr:hypothetical protein [Desulfitobacterium sp.]MEA4902215.1 hypothetical protein [Desulfitobacterium sp.]